MDIGIGPPIDEIAARSAADPLLVVRPVAPGAALGLVGAGFDQTTDTDGAPTTDGYDRLRSLLVMRVNHGGVPVQMPPYPVEMEDDEADALVDEFLRTEYGNRLAAKPEAVAEIVRMWLAHAVTRTVGDPLRVSAVLVEMFLTDWAPRYLADDPDGLAAVPGVIAEWLRFVAARRPVPSALVTHALAAVEHYTPVMQHRAASYRAGAGAGAE